MRRGNVDTRLDEIDIAIIQNDFHIQVGMLVQEHGRWGITCSLAKVTAAQISERPVRLAAAPARPVPLRPLFQERFARS